MPDQTAPTEAALISRAQHGDTAAYEELIRRHRPAAYRVALSLMGDRDEADDAAQDACIKAYYALHTFQAGAPFEPWLVTIAANAARNRQRSNQRRGNAAHRAADDRSPTIESLDPEAAFLARERHDALHSALGRLRAEDREVVHSRYFAALSEAEMADRLGIARGTVKSRLSRAISRLRTALAAAAVAVFILLAAVLAFSREARDAIADRLGLRGVEITHVPPEVVPTPQSAAPFSLPTALAGANLGVRVGIDDARALNAGRLYTPSAPELGPLRAVYILQDGRARVTTLIYTPPAGSDGTILLAQISGTLEPAVVGKGLGPDARLTPVMVDSQRGFWLDGRPHFVVFRDQCGEFREDTLRLAGNTLLWQADTDLLLRLEGLRTLEQALRVASSVQR